MIFEFNGIRIFEHGENYEGYEVGDVIEHPDLPGIFLRAKEEPKSGGITTTVILNAIDKRKPQIVDELLEGMYAGEDPSFKALLEYFVETIEE